MPLLSSISVVIPHLNQPIALKRCLASLSIQAGEITPREIVVVDNGSHCLPTAECATFKNVTLLQEMEPGPGPARNRGIASTSGDIVAFIDADCTAHERWLAEILLAFRENPQAVILGGRVVIPRSHANTTMLEAYESIYAYRMAEYIRKHGYSGTGNLAVRRKVLEEVGPFGGIHIAEDSDWGKRAHVSGYCTTYTPKMIVYHPARNSFLELKKKWDRQIAHGFNNMTGAKARLLWALRAFAILISPLAEIFRLLTTNRVQGARERCMAFICLIRIRVYRAYRMLSLLIKGNANSLSGAWNRESVKIKK